MSNKKGFTLIEILAVIIIIGVIAIIAIPSISKYLKSSKDTVYISYEKTMVDAAKNKVVECLSSEKSNCELPEKEEELKLYLDILIDEGYLDNMKDPETKEFCEAANSYIKIKGDNAGDYKYKACLYCGDYFTDDVDCSEVNNTGTGERDPENPTCGTITGDSTRWSNQNRTVSVGCGDVTTGCVQSVFSKTFTKTTKVGKIIIRDKSGNTDNCEVNVFVDKSLPTCKIDIIPEKSGEFIEETGWYSLKATAAIQDMKDGENESGLLTYGMGTSLANRDYNKKNELEVGKGITTVKVGTEIPKFNLFYGYPIFPNSNDSIALNGITISGSEFTTSSTTPKITIINTSKYKNVEKLIITLNSAIETETTATLKATGLTKTAPMAQGSKVIEFLVSKGTYDSYEIQLGTINGVKYNVQKIEILTKDGSEWTNKDITMYVEPVDDGMRTTKVSYDNGESWVTTFSKTYTTKTTNTVLTKNGIGMISRPTEFTTKIDKVMPTSSMTAKRKSNGNVVSVGSYTNEGLNFTFNKGTVGESGSKLYYCKDTNNTCTPNIEVANGATITDFNSITTNYYIRYRAMSDSEEIEAIKSYNAKFDLVKPVCTFGTLPIVYVNNTATLDITCIDALSGYVDKDLTASNFTLSNSNATIQSVTKANVTNGKKYTITLKGISHGNITVTLKAGQVNDNALNTNDAVTTGNVEVKGVFKVTLNNQSATTAGTTEVYELYTIGWYTNSSVSTQITSITKPDRKGYSFGGYYTSTGGAGTQIIDANGGFVSGSQSSFLSDTTIYAKWTECTNKTGVYSWSSGCTVSACNENYYKNGNACTICANGTTTSAGNTSTSCSACTNGTGVYSWTGAGCTVSTCNANYYKNGNACSICGNGTTTSAGNTSTSCSACTNGTGVYSWTGAGCTVSTCKAGYGKNGNACSACSAGTTSSNGNTGCSACSNATGVYTWSSGCTIATCKAGYGKSGNSCVGCSAGTTSSNGNTGCSACSNNANVASWSSGCTIASCKSGYVNSSNSCVGQCSSYSHTSTSCGGCSSAYNNVAGSRTCTKYYTSNYNGVQCTTSTYSETCYGTGHLYSWNDGNNHSTVGYCTAYCPSYCGNRGYGYWTCEGWGGGVNASTVRGPSGAYGIFCWCST